MDIRKVKKLIELLEESGINEIEIHEGEESVRISRGSPAAAAPVQYSAQPAAPTAPAPASTEHAEAPAQTIDGEVLESPMVGTYYAATSPDADPFVSVGSKVEKGDTLCIIEAMKIMNQIEAECSGTVVSIERKNGEPVEYGDPLFIIRP